MPYRSITVSNATLLCFPEIDVAFGSFVRETYASLATPSQETLERDVRRIYPSTVVRERETLAGFGERAFYVYRDGRHSPFGEDGAWWETPECARLVIGPDGRYEDGNEAALELFGVDRDALLQARSGDFTTPEHRSHVPWLLQLLRDTGELHSTSVLRPRHGGPDLAVEFHLRLAEDGSGRMISSFRPVPLEAALATDPPVGSPTPPLASG
jgi:PAS domain S-box-containing protein